MGHLGQMPPPPYPQAPNPFSWSNDVLDGCISEQVAMKTHLKVASILSKQLVKQSLSIFFVLGASKINYCKPHSKYFSCCNGIIQHKCWRSVEHQVLRPAKDFKFRTVCLKSCRQEKKIHDPAAIRFTLERLQESARRSGYFLPVFFHAKLLLSGFCKRLWDPNKNINLFFPAPYNSGLLVPLPLSTLVWRRLPLR